MFSYEVITVKSVAVSVSQLFLLPIHLPILNYVAGQYVHIIHKDQLISPLSLALSPHVEGKLEFHLFHAKDNVKANHLLQMAEIDKIWHLTGPYGDCTVNRLSEDKPILFLARGTGFAPIKAVIEALIKKSHHPPLYFYWSVPREEDFYLLDLLNRWSLEIKDFHFIPVVTQDQSSDLPVKVILSQHVDLSNYQVYASGPRPLIEIALTAFQEKGLPREAFFSDVLTL